MTIVRLAQWALVPAASFAIAAVHAQPAVPAGAPEARKPMPLEQRVEKERFVRLDRVLGMDVRNAAGENLGTVHDIVIDASQNQVRYAVIGFGGFLGLGQDHFAYPVEVLELTPQRDAVLLRVTREQLERAPGFDARRIPDWNAYLGQVDRFWGPVGAGRTAPPMASQQVPPGAALPPGTVEPGRAGPGAVTPAEPMPGTAREPGVGFAREPAPAVAPSPVPRPGVGVARPVPPRMPDEVRRLEAVTADDLIGRGIRDRQGRHIGHIRDIVADFRTGDIAFAVVALDRGWLEPDRLATLPMERFRRDPRFAREVVLDMSAQQVAQAPAFHADRWPQFEAQDFRTAWQNFLAGIRQDGRS